MPSMNDAWGIEVGASAIKAIHLQRTGAGEVRIADFEVVAYQKVLSSPDADSSQTIRAALDEFLALHPIRKETVVSSIPGHMAFARFAKLPPVEPKKIPDIVKFEAVQQIPFAIEQVEWDYQTFQAPDSPEVEVGIFAITKERLNPWLENFSAVGMPLHGLALAPVAVFNALNYDRDLEQKKTSTILMDIGTQATDLVITEAGRAWLRTIPIGGNHFTDALVSSFKLSHAKAEKLKREAATSKYARQIFQAMRPVFVDLVQEVQKSLGYYQSLNREAELDQLIGLGATFRLPGLQTFLKQQLQIEVKRLDAFHKIEVDGKSAAAFSEHVLGLAPAYGLALHGLGMERVACNLLPTPVIRRSIWRAKQKWFVAAAAVVVACSALAYLSLMFAKQRYETSENEQARSQVQQIVGRAERIYQQWQSVEQTADPRGRIANLNRILDYRDVWPGILRDLDLAILSLNPQPELSSGDPQRIASIPRNQWNVIFIEDLTATYGVAEEDLPAQEEPTEPATDEQGQPIVPDAPAAAEDWPAPKYRVTLTGTTPNREPAQLLDTRFNAYLREHGDQPDRLYRITNVELKTIQPVTTNATLQPQDDTGYQPNMPNVPTRGSRGSVAPVGMDQFGPTGGVDQLLGKPLIDGRPQPGDTRFTIEWTIELKPPGGGRGNDTAPDAEQPIAGAEVLHPLTETQP